MILCVLSVGYIFLLIEIIVKSVYIMILWKSKIKTIIQTNKFT